MGNGNRPSNMGNGNRPSNMGNGNRPNNAMNIVSDNDTGKNLGSRMGGLVNNAANSVRGAINNMDKKINNIPDMNNIKNRGKSAMGSIDVSSVNKYLMILLIGVLFILIIIFAHFLIMKIYESTDTEPYLVKGTKSGQHTVVIRQNPESINYIPILRSENKNGMEFSYSFWILIMDMKYKEGEWKHIFHKGNSSSYPNRAPGVWLHPNKNTLRVYMNTFDCPLREYIDIPNIPIKKWICVQIVLQNINSHTTYDDRSELNQLIENKQDHILDFYLNGQLKRSKTLTGIPKQNNGDLWVNLFGGFNGYLSKLRYHARALKYNEIEDVVKKGPASIVTADTGELPPYLDEKWWHDDDWKSI